MNIFQAIQLEETYLGLGKKEADEFNLPEKLAEQGFSLDEFAKEKARLLFDASAFKFKPTSPETTHSDVQKAIEKNEAVVFVSAQDKPWFFIGGDGRTAPKGVDACNIGYGCSSILSTPKDVNIVIVSRQKNTLSLWQEWLDRELIGVPHESTIGAEKDLGEWSVYYFQISFKDGRELLLEKWLK